MLKIPFDLVAPILAKITQQIAGAKGLDALNYWWELHDLLLEATGWDTKSFTEEELKRLDEDWETDKPIIWN